MDNTDRKLLELLQGNARMPFQELGDALGMSRTAAKKRVKKLEDAGIICGYNTYIRRPEEITLLIDIVTKPDCFEEVVQYVTTRTAWIRQIFRTTKENHIHMVAAAESVSDLKYLTSMIRKDCAESIAQIETHAVKEIIKDVYASGEKTGGQRTLEE